MNPAIVAAFVFQLKTVAKATWREVEIAAWNCAKWTVTRQIVSYGVRFVLALWR